MKEIERIEIIRYVKQELRDIVFINQNSSIKKLIHDLVRIIKEQEDGLTSFHDLYDRTVEHNSEYVTKNSILKEENDKLKQDNEILTELAGTRLAVMGSMFANITDPSQAILQLRSRIYQLNNDLSNVNNKYTKELIQSQISTYQNTISDFQAYYEVNENEQ